nr:uncharacterized protein LOC109174735 [Ipomoea trifida]
MQAPGSSSSIGTPATEAFQTDEGVVGEVESTDEEYDSGDYLEDELDELDKLEDSDYEIDDSEFLKFIDPEVEYAGEGNVAIPETEVAEQVPTNTEVDLSYGELNLGESVRPNPPPPDQPMSQHLGNF